MTELDELEQKSENEKKIRQKRRVRGVLLVVSGMLLAYVGFLGVQSIIDAVKNNQSKNGDIISILDKGEKDSLKIYESFINSDNAPVEVSDFATYGRYLLTSNGRVDANNLSAKVENSKAILSKLVTTSSAVTYGDASLIYTIGSSLNEQIDLFSLERGEYIVFNGASYENRKVFHYAGEEYFEETIYSFPAKSGTRKKITIKGKASSPAMVIEVTNTTNLPKDYYDIVVINSENLQTKENWLETLKTDYSVKECASIEEAYSYNSTYALSITSGSEIVASNYVSGYAHEGKITSTNIYNGLDEDNFIRELGGYVFNAGYGVNGDDDIAKMSTKIHNIKKDSHTGKFAVKVGNNVELENVTKILNS